MSRDEAHDCVDKYVTDPSDNEDMHEMVDYAFDNGADLIGDGSLDEAELTKLINGGPPKSYVQLWSQLGGGPSSNQIIDSCDAGEKDAALSR